MGRQTKSTLQNGIPAIFQNPEVEALLAKGKDVIIQVEEGEFPYPAYFFRGFPKVVEREGLYLTSTEQRIIDLIREAGMHPASLPELLFLGGRTTPRREAQALAFPSHAICCTATRLIDHIRRDNLSLQHIRRVVMEYPRDGETAEIFKADVEFVLSKVPSHPQCIVLSSDPQRAIADLKEVLSHPQIVPLSSWKKSRTEKAWFPLEAPERMAEAVADLILSHDLKKVICYVPEALTEKLRRTFIRTHISFSSILRDSSPGAEDRALKKFKTLDAEVLLLEAPRPFPSLYTAKAVIFAGVPGPDIFLQGKRCLSEHIPLTHLFLLAPQTEEERIHELESRVGSIARREPPDEEAVAQGFLERVLECVDGQSPHVIEPYRKAFRKAVPFFRRADVAAYLVRNILSDSARSLLPMQDIFFSMGKNRKIFPEDLKELVLSVEGLTEEDIGEIRVLDNYSFVEVSEPFAEKVISTLNGTDFKGKRLTVNYGKRRSGR